MPADTPAEVTTSPSSTNRASLRTSMLGSISASRSREAQCVVAGRPDSSAGGGIHQSTGTDARHDRHRCPAGAGPSPGARRPRAADECLVPPGESGPRAGERQQRSNGPRCPVPWPPGSGRRLGRDIRRHSHHRGSGGSRKPALPTGPPRRAPRRPERAESRCASFRAGPGPSPSVDSTRAPLRPRTTSAGPHPADRVTARRGRSGVISSQ